MEHTTGRIAASYLPALVFLHVCVDDICERQAEQTEGCLHHDPVEKTTIYEQAGKHCHGFIKKIKK